MNPKELRNALVQETWYNFNMFLVLSEWKENQPDDYKTIEKFVLDCQKGRGK